MRKHFLVVMSAVLCICAWPSHADESARAQMKGLDEQVQEVKSDVLNIAAELNQLATHYIYSFKELDALRRGGVQRIYSGNIATGAHEIAVSVSGKLANGKDYTQTERFPFTKEIKPKLIGVMLAGPDAAQPGIHLGDW